MVGYENWREMCNKLILLVDSYQDNQRDRQVCWVGNYDIQKKEITNYFAAIVQTQNHSLQNAKVKYLENIDQPTEVAMKFMLMRSDDNKINFQTIDNLINLPILNEAELLYSIKQRFLHNQIFSYVGQTLVIVNPFKEISDVFSKEILEKFKSCAKKKGFVLKQEQPHIYAIAALSYNQLFEFFKSQSIVISGESGTGKTVNIKLCMSLIAQMSSQKSSSNQSGHQLEQQIIQCNPILEAFGNAKTIKNDNSSRFGKFVNIFIDMKTEKIMGARTQSYLLEKSRVIQQSKEERNYHIFYSLLSSNEPDLLEKLGLKDKNQKVKYQDFNYLKKSECFTVSSINDLSMFIDVTQSLITLGIEDEEILNIWQILAGVLHLGNLDFDDQFSENSSDTPCQIIEVGRSSCEKISSLLGVKNEKLKDALLKKTIKVGNKETVSPKIKIDVISHLHSLSKDLYDKLFLWLIMRMNEKLILISDKEIQLKIISNQIKQIGLLDIFGFEVLQHNSFEQLCINYANEVLQQLYIEYTFKSEQTEFEEQGLQDDFNQIPYLDNREVINLLDKTPFGLFPQIDEISSLATSGDDSLYNKIKDQHKSNPLIIVPTIKSDKFTIQHTPRQVQYSITGFRAKNKDEMSSSFIYTLMESSNTILRDIYYEEQQLLQSQNNNPKGNQNKDKFIGTKFRKQINSLIQELRQSDVHFIRCIKPNESKQPNNFSDEIIINQLRYLGVLDTIKIRKEGFPVRKDFKDFFRKFGEIEPQSKNFFQLEKENADFKKFTENMEIWRDNFQPKDQKKQILFGKTKICFRSEAYDQLEAIYSEKMKKKTEAVMTIQRIGRGYIARLYSKEVKIKLLLINRWLVSRYVRIQFLKKKKAIQTISKFYKKILFRRIRSMAMIVQKYVQRAILVRKYQYSIKQIVESQKYIKSQIKLWKQKRYANLKRTIVLNGFNIAWARIINRNATMIQKLIKGYLVRNVFHKEKLRHIQIYMIKWYQNKSANKIQKIIRGYLGRKYVQSRWTSVMRIQGFIRSKWLHELRLKMKNAATYIQKFYKRYSEKTKNQRSYFNSEDLVLQNIQIAEQSAMLSSKMMLLDQSRRDNTINNLDSKEARISRDHLTPQDKKISFFIFILDYEILTDTSEIYDPLWNKQYSILQKEMLSTNHDITHIQVGEAHTLASSTNGKIYCWGWNDYNQLGTENIEGQFSTRKPIPIPWIEEITRPKSFSVGSNHSFVLDVENNLYVQGKNSNGQLGLGHNEQVEDPERLDINIKPDDRVKLIKSRYDQSVLVTEKGTAFIWPLQQSNTEWINEPFEIIFPQSKIQISQASCGLKFTVFLANNGVLFSMGSNEQGELGLGDSTDRTFPCLIESLKLSGEKIQQVECGQKHTICKSGLNKIFTWGMGARGQLGHDSKGNEYYPRQVNLQMAYNKYKIMQVQASHKSCLVLLENRKILWWGTNNHLKTQTYPIELDFSAYDKSISNQDFHPVRIETTWSKTLSITYLRMADTRTFDQGTQFKQKLINTLIQKWQESQLNTMDVPFFDSISKNFSNRHVLKNYSDFKRIGPKYPKQKSEKYFLVQKSSPSKRGFGYLDDTEVDNLNSSMMSSTSPVKPSKNVFENFIRSSSKKQLKIFKQNHNDPEGIFDQESKQLASPISKSQNKEDEYLLDTIKVSPNSLLEKYKNEHKNSQKISQFEINIHKVPTLNPSTQTLQKSKTLQPSRLQPPQFGIVKQQNNVGQYTRGSVDSDASTSKQKSKERPKQTVKFSDSENQKSQFSNIQHKDSSDMESSQQSNLSNNIISPPIQGQKSTLSNIPQNQQPSYFQQEFNFNAQNQDFTPPKRDNMQQQPSQFNQTNIPRKENRQPEKKYPKYNQQAIKELKFNQVTKDQVKYPFIHETVNENKPVENDEFINSLHQKLAGIKSRMQTLARIPKEEWTLDDHQFMNEVSNSKMIEFFKSIS